MEEVAGAIRGLIQQGNAKHFGPSEAGRNRSVARTRSIR